MFVWEYLSRVPKYYNNHATSKVTLNTLIDTNFEFLDYAYMPLSCCHVLSYWVIRDLY